jgi:hypothetical protein
MKNYVQLKKLAQSINSLINFSNQKSKIGIFWRALE